MYRDMPWASRMETEPAKKRMIGGRSRPKPKKVRAPAKRVRIIEMSQRKAKVLRTIMVGPFRCRYSGGTCLGVLAIRRCLFVGRRGRCKEAFELLG